MHCASTEHNTWLRQQAGGCPGPAFRSPELLEDMDAAHLLGSGGVVRPALSPSMGGDVKGKGCDNACTVLLHWHCDCAPLSTSSKWPSRNLVCTGGQLPAAHGCALPRRHGGCRLVTPPLCQEETSCPTSSRRGCKCSITFTVTATDTVPTQTGSDWPVQHPRTIAAAAAVDWVLCHRAGTWQSPPC